MKDIIKHYKDYRRVIFTHPPDPKITLPTPIYLQNLFQQMLISTDARTHIDIFLENIELCKDHSPNIEIYKKVLLHLKKEQICNFQSIRRLFKVTVYDTDFIKSFIDNKYLALIAGEYFMKFNYGIDFISKCFFNNDILVIYVLVAYMTNFNFSLYDDFCGVFENVFKYFGCFVVGELLNVFFVYLCENDVLVLQNFIIEKILDLEKGNEINKQDLKKFLDNVISDFKKKENKFNVQATKNFNDNVMLNFKKKENKFTVQATKNSNDQSIKNFNGIVMSDFKNIENKLHDQSIKNVYAKIDNNNKNMNNNKTLKKVDCENNVDNKKLDLLCDNYGDQFMINNENEDASEYNKIKIFIILNIVLKKLMITHTFFYTTNNFIEKIAPELIWDNFEETMTVIKTYKKDYDLSKIFKKTSNTKFTSFILQQKDKNMLEMFVDEFLERINSLSNIIPILFVYKSYDMESFLKIRPIITENLDDIDCIESRYLKDEDNVSFSESYVNGISFIDFLYKPTHKDISCFLKNIVLDLNSKVKNSIDQQSKNEGNDQNKCEKICMNLKKNEIDCENKIKNDIDINEKNILLKETEILCLLKYLEKTNTIDKYLPELLKISLSKLRIPIFFVLAKSFDPIFNLFIDIEKIPRYKVNEIKLRLMKIYDLINSDKLLRVFFIDYLFTKPEIVEKLGIVFEDMDYFKEKVFMVENIILRNSICKAYNIEIPLEKKECNQKYDDKIKKGHENITFIVDENKRKKDILIVDNSNKETSSFYVDDNKKQNNSLIYDDNTILLDNNAKENSGFIYDDNSVFLENSRGTFPVTNNKLEDNKKQNNAFITNNNTNVLENADDNVENKSIKRSYIPHISSIIQPRNNKKIKEQEKQNIFSVLSYPELLKNYKIQDSDLIFKDRITSKLTASFIKITAEKEITTLNHITTVINKFKDSSMLEKILKLGFTHFKRKNMKTYFENVRILIDNIDFDIKNICDIVELIVNKGNLTVLYSFLMKVDFSVVVECYEKVTANALKEGLKDILYTTIRNKILKQYKNNNINNNIFEEDNEFNFHNNIDKECIESNRMFNLESQIRHINNIHNEEDKDNGDKNNCDEDKKNSNNYKIANKIDITLNDKIKNTIYDLLQNKKTLIDGIKLSTEFLINEKKAYEIIASHLLTKDDKILLQVIEYLLKKSGNHSEETNEKLYNLLFKRSRLDKIGENILKIIHIKEEYLERLYEMFFIDPKKYVSFLPKILKKGYKITFDMVKELIKILGKSNDCEERGNIMSMVKYIDLKNNDVIDLVCCIIENIESSHNSASKKCLCILLEKYYCHEFIVFVKLAMAIGNEKDLDVLKNLLVILKSQKKRFRNVVDEWLAKKNLKKLVYRIYLAYYDNLDVFKGLKSSIVSKEEADVVESVFSGNLGR